MQQLEINQTTKQSSQSYTDTQLALLCIRRESLIRAIAALESLQIAYTVFNPHASSIS
jgi:hypothetical protein